MKALVAVLVLALAGLAAWFFVSTSETAPPAEMTDAEIAQIEAEALAVMDVLMEGFNELDPDKLQGITHPEFTAFPWGGDLVTHAEYREVIANWTAGRVSWNGSWTDTDVRVLSADHVAFTGTYSTTISYPDGRTMFTPKGCIIALLERTTEGWKWSLLSGTSTGGQPVEGT